jgi:hypothetical protein
MSLELCVQSQLLSGSNTNISYLDPSFVNCLRYQKSGKEHRPWCRTQAVIGAAPFYQAESHVVKDGV